MRVHIAGMGQVGEGRGGVGQVGVGRGGIGRCGGLGRLVVLVLVLVLVLVRLLVLVPVLVLVFYQCRCGSARFGAVQSGVVLCTVQRGAVRCGTA